MSTGGTVTRNETLTTSPETAPATQAPVTSSTEYVNTNTTMPGGQALGQGVGLVCPAWSSAEIVPEVETDAPSDYVPEHAASFDYNVRFTCEITARNKRKCTAKCLNGGKIVGKNKFVMSCKCPRWVSPRSYIINYDSL